MAQAKSQKNFRQTMGNFQMLQQTKSNYGNKRKQIIGAKSASRMANPELGISTRRISAVRRTGNADKVPEEADGSQKRPTITKLHIPAMKANVHLAPHEGEKADQTENSRDAMIKLVDLDRYIHQGEASPSRKSQLQTLNGASATGQWRHGRSSGKQGGEKPMAASISLESLKAINKLAAGASGSIKPLESRQSGQNKSVGQQMGVVPVQNQSYVENNQNLQNEFQNLKKLKPDQFPINAKEMTIATKVAAVALTSVVHTPPALDAIYCTESQVVVGAASISGEDRGHTEKIRKLQEHQQNLQLGSGTIEGQASSPRSGTENIQLENTARNILVRRQLEAMTVEGTQIRSQINQFPGATNLGGGPTLSSPNSPRKATKPLDFLKSQGSKLEAAVSALNGVVQQNRAQQQSKHIQGAIQKQRTGQNKNEKIRTTTKKKERDLPECSEASTLKRSSILEKQDNGDGFPLDINNGRFGRQPFQETAQERRNKSRGLASGESSGARRHHPLAYSARASRRDNGTTKSKNGAEALQYNPEAAKNQNFNIILSQPQQAPGCQTEQTIVQRSLQYNSSLAILQASQRMAERGLVFGQLPQYEQDQILAEQHQILLSIEANKGYVPKYSAEKSRLQTSINENKQFKNLTIGKSQSQNFAKSISS